MPAILLLNWRLSLQTKAEVDQYFSQLEADGELQGHIKPDQVLILPNAEKVIKARVLTTGATFFINLCSSPKVLTPCMLPGLHHRKSTLDQSDNIKVGGTRHNH